MQLQNPLVVDLVQTGATGKEVYIRDLLGLDLGPESTWAKGESCLTVRYTLLQDVYQQPAHTHPSGELGYARFYHFTNDSAAQFSDVGIAWPNSWDAASLHARFAAWFVGTLACFIQESKNAGAFTIFTAAPHTTIAIARTLVSNLVFQAFRIGRPDNSDARTQWWQVMDYLNGRIAGYADVCSTIYPDAPLTLEQRNRFYDVDLSKICIDGLGSVQHKYSTFTTVLMGLNFSLASDYGTRV